MNEKEKAMNLAIKLDEKAEKLNRTYQEFIREILKRIKL